MGRVWERQRIVCQRKTGRRLDLARTLYNSSKELIQCMCNNFIFERVEDDDEIKDDEVTDDDNKAN